MPLCLLHEPCVYPLLHQLHTGGRTGDLRARLQSLSLLQLQTYSFLFLSSLPAGSLTSLSASLGTQCHCSGPPWLSLGSSWDRLRAQAGRHGCSREPSEGRELMVYGVEAGNS